MGIVDLAFDNSVIANCQAEVLAIFDRVERGESTFEQEDAALECVKKCITHDITGL